MLLSQHFNFILPFVIVIEIKSLPQGKIKNHPLFSGWFALSLRREGDSNPRYSFPYGSLANCWFKPLTHLSKIIYLILTLRSFSEGGSPNSALKGDMTN